MRRKFFVLLATIAISAPGFAERKTEQDNPPLTEAAAPLIQQANEKHLENSQQWHALLHYRKTIFGLTDHQKSEIISPEFFLSEFGATNPNSELAATLSAFFQPVGSDANKHPQCRFPARYKWLRQQLDWKDITPPAVPCKRYQEWAQEGQIKSVSLIFATGYLSNPASLYGHLLIKLNTSDEIVANELLDPSMSYGAIVPKHENSLVYMYKGLFGGYEAGFSHDKFFQHNHNYAETELRDLWEYHLALRSDEVELIVSHGWELLGVRFNYYFLSNNCAYEVSELLKLVVDQPLLPSTPWSIPSTVFNSLTIINRRNEPLVSAVKKIPSRQNRFYVKYFAMQTRQQMLTKRIISDPTRLNSPDYLNMSNDDRIRIVETLFDYYEFRTSDEISPEKYRQKKQLLISERLKLPAQKTVWPQTKEIPPHESNPPFLTQISSLENGATGSAVELRVRPAYYDMLSLDAGKIPYSSLSMLDLRLLYNDDGLKFRSLDLLGIETLNPSRTGVPGDGNYAWSIRIGLEQQNLYCSKCTVTFAEGGIGKATSVGSNGVIYAMLEGRLQSNWEGLGTLAGSGHIGLLLEPMNGWKSRLSIGERAYINGTQTIAPIIRWENRFGSNKNWDWGLSMERNAANEIKASLAFHW